MKQRKVDYSSIIQYLVRLLETFMYVNIASDTHKLEIRATITAGCYLFRFL